jgi:hypothetical protein
MGKRKEAVREGSIRQIFYKHEEKVYENSLVTSLEDVERFYIHAKSILKGFKNNSAVSWICSVRRLNFSDYP